MRIGGSFLEDLEETLRKCILFFSVLRIQEDPLTGGTQQLVRQAGSIAQKVIRELIHKS